MLVLMLVLDQVPVLVELVQVLFQLLVLVCWCGSRYRTRTRTGPGPACFGLLLFG